LLEMLVFSDETQLYYLTNQLHVSTTLSNHHQADPEIYDTKDTVAVLVEDIGIYK
jgi:hypothetical protein